MKFKKILPQFLTLLFIVLIFGFFTMNAQENMDTRGIEFGFGFLKQEASFDIQFSLIDYDGNVICTSLFSWIFKHFISFFYWNYFMYNFRCVIGVARLSPNYLINKTASFYVEFFRNIPLLLQIFFWYFAALRALPMPEDAPLIFGSSFMTIKGLYTPAPVWNNFDVFLISLIIALIVIFFFNKFAKKNKKKRVNSILNF
jgi:general L-amino acid transport system permease protein